MFKQIWAFFGARYFPVAFARSIGVVVGESCRLIKCEYSTEPYLIRLGCRVSATKVRFETHDGGVWVLRGSHPELDVISGIDIGDNVYFGYGCLVLPGTVVGDNVVIGAGAVVRGVIDSNSVYAGVPARKIRTLAEYEVNSLRKGVHTKSMSSSEKRAFLEKKFLPEMRRGTVDGRQK